MKKCFALVWICLMLSSCSSWIFGQKKVECCENQAACCHEQMCCLVRYAKSAGKEPKVFTPDVPVYARPEDLEAPEGATVVKPGILSYLNPWGSKFSDLEEEEKAEAVAPSDDDDDSLFKGLLPF
jgi:hypothetical protein